MAHADERQAVYRAQAQLLYMPCAPRMAAGFTTSQNEAVSVIQACNLGAPRVSGPEMSVWGELSNSGKISEIVCAHGRCAHSIREVHKAMISAQRVTRKYAGRTLPRDI